MKDTKELRSFLVEQMNGVANGQVDMVSAKSVSNLAQQIYNTLNIEIKMALARGKLDGDNIKAVAFDE